MNHKSEEIEENKSGNRKKSVMLTALAISIDYQYPLLKQGVIISVMHARMTSRTGLWHLKDIEFSLNEQ